MFEHSILGKLPALLRWLCELVAQSATYRAAARVWHGILNCARSSKVFGALFRESTLEARVSQSVLFSSLQRLTNRFFATLQKRYLAMRPALMGSTIGRGYLRAYRYHWSAHPIVLLGLFVFAMLVIPHDFWGNSYALLAGVVLTAIWVGMVAVQKREPFSVSRLGVPFYCFVGCCVLGVLRAAETDDAIRVFFFFLTAFLLYSLVVSEVDSKEKLHRLLGWLMVGVSVTAIYAFFQRVAGVAVDESLTDLTANAGMPGRVFSTVQNPNNYAEILVLTLPLCFVFCTQIRRPQVRFLSFVMLALAVGALLMTYSRSCWVSFAIAVVVFVFLYDKRYLPLILLVAFAAIPLLPESILNRILTIGSQSDSSNAYRLYIWESALQMIRDNWFTGLGMGPDTFYQVYLQYANPIASNAAHAHMLYLELWLELGLVGLLAFFWFMIDLLRSGVRAAKRTTDTYPKHVLYACVASFAGISFAAAAEYIWFYPRVLFIFFLVAGILKAALRLCNKSKELDA